MEYVCSEKGENEMFFGEPSIIVGIIVMVITIRDWRKRKELEKPIDEKRLKELYGDIIMTLTNQVKAREIHRGDAEKKADEWTEKIVKQLGKSGRISYSKIKRTYREIVKDFASVSMTNEERVL